MARLGEAGIFSPEEILAMEVALWLHREHQLQNEVIILNMSRRPCKTIPLNRQGGGTSITQPDLIMCSSAGLIIRHQEAQQGFTEHPVVAEL